MAQREQHERVKKMDRWAGKLLGHKAVVMAMLVVIAMASGLAMANLGGGAGGVSFERTDGSGTLVVPGSGDASSGKTSEGSSPKASAAAEVYVDVDGAVVSPGVYRLKDGARVAQAIDAAGGLAPEADVTGLNRASKVTDGQKIHVPTVGEQQVSIAEAGVDGGASASSGVNGVGKTTTIGKLAHQLHDQGKKVLLCAGDTFRAAAADQLEIWSERAHCDIIRQHEGADPASVVFDAIAAARARGSDVIICDTAGRLHNKQNLMNELNKISRILDRELPGASKEVLLVLDGTTSQNGLLQARQFQECAGVTEMVLTKLDGTAKGGVVIAVAQALHIPVKFIGVGEQIDDLMPFDAKSFAEALI